MTTEWLKRHRFTVEEYHRMGVTGVLPPDARVELIDGEVLEMSPRGREHMALVDRMTYHFVKRFGGRAIVSVQNSVRLGRHSEPQPDILLLRPRADFYAAAVRTAGDVLLAIEVADASLAMDRTVKIPLYARSGIPETWLVDVAENAIEVYRNPGQDGFATMTRVTRGGVLTVAAFPGETFPAEEVLG